MFFDKRGDVPMNETFAPSLRTRIRRKAYAHYDEATVFKILDAGVLAHIGYVVDGAPYVTPTAYWRENDRLYWHGSAASRLLHAQQQPLPVCLTVSHIDGFVLARCAFAHAMLYRSVMAFGQAEFVTDIDAKRHVLERFVERLYPQRSRDLRPTSPEELAATSVMVMTIEAATAKVSSPEARGGGVGVIEKRESDYDTAVWAGVIPVRIVTGEAHADDRLRVDPALPPDLALYAEGARLDDALAHFALQQDGAA
jgi:uncharacterized protein